MAGGLPLHFINSLMASYTSHNSHNGAIHSIYVIKGIFPIVDEVVILGRALPGKWLA